MKTPSDELFKLIKSMSTQEKVYFKKENFNKNGSNAYRLVFDIINKMNVYDERKLKIKLKNYNGSRHFKSLKSRTFEAILNTLQNYHTDTTTTLELSGKVKQIEILLYKQLYSPALKLINKALQLAKEQEKFLYVLHLSQWKTEVLKHTEDIKTFQSYLKTELPKETEYVNKVKNQIEYSILLNKLFPFVKSNQLEGAVLPNKEIQSVFSKPLLNDINKATSYNSLMYYYQIKMVESRAKGDWKKSHKIRKKLVELSATKNEKKQLNLIHYIASLYNLLTSIKYTNNPVEYDFYYNKTKVFFKSLSGKQLSPFIYQLYLSIEISYIDQQLRIGEYEKSVDLAEEVKKIIETNTNVNIENKIYFYFYAFHGNFMLRKFKLALSNLNDIIKFTKAGIKLDIVYSLRMLHLVVYYETGTIDLLPGMAKSIKRFLFKRGYIFKYEHLLLDLFDKRIPKAGSKKNINDLFKQSIEQLTEIFKDETEAKALTYFDYISWMESKITNKPFAEILLQKKADLHVLPAK